MSFPFGRKYTLIFLNVARDPDILVELPGNGKRLSGLLADLGDMMADNGSLVFPLGSLRWNADYVEREC